MLKSIGLQLGFRTDPEERDRYLRRTEQTSKTRVANIYLVFPDNLRYFIANECYVNISLQQAIWLYII